jgi:hypothetical protein
MRRSKAEYWSNRRVLWQQYSLSHSSQYHRRFFRLLANRSNQSFDSVEIDLNRCRHECRSRCLAFNNWSICRESVFSQMSLQMRHLMSLHRWKISFSSIRRRSHLLFRWLFSVVFWRFCVLISLSFCFRSHKHDRFSILRFENFFDFFWSVVSSFDDFSCNVANASWIVLFVINVRAIRKWFRNSFRRFLINVENFFWFISWLRMIFLSNTNDKFIVRNEFRKSYAHRSFCTSDKFSRFVFA